MAFYKMVIFTCIAIFFSLIIIFSNKKQKPPAPTSRNRIQKSSASQIAKPHQNNILSIETESEKSEYDSNTQQPYSQNNINSVIIELSTQYNNDKQSVNKNEDDELVTFTITSDNYSKKSEIQDIEDGRWLPQDSSITIQNRELNKGFIFYGSKLMGLNGYSSEDSLIDPALPVSEPVEIENETEFYTDATLCYWPSYSELSPQCRGIYLDWLASDRSHPNMPIGYVFLYFYGLERRIIANKNSIHLIDTKEYFEIFYEIIRLRKIYDSNYSFNNYSGNLLALMIYLRPAITKQLKNELFQFSNELFFKLILAVTVKNEKPVKASLALDWLDYTPEYYFRTAARRCKEEFRQLFFLKFNEHFPAGILIKPNKTRLKIDYQAANRSIGFCQWDNPNLPDPSILTKPLKSLIAIAELCTNLLGEYSRYLARENSSRNDITALTLLPAELFNKNDSAVIKQFRAWVNHVLLEQNGLASVKDFWKNINTELPKAINKKENELMQRMANKFGLTIIPDSRIQTIKINPEDKIVLHDSLDLVNFQPSAEFRYTELLIRLGVIVANIDGFIHEKEIELLKRFIDSNQNLQDTEKQYLQLFLLSCLNNTHGMQGLRDKIAKLDSNQRKIISHLLISIALADGDAAPAEIKQIEKLYTALGLDKFTVVNDIHTLSASSNKTLQKQPLAASENNKTDTDKKSDIILDSAILKLHESETSDVQSLLSSIFTDIEEEPTVPQPELPDNQNLDSTHQQLLNILITREHWKRDEYIELCKKFNLLPDGAIETINEWAYECVDAPLIEENNDIYIDFEILTELQG